MTSSTPGDVEESLGIKLERITLDGDYLLSNYPHLEMSTATSLIGSPRDRDSTSALSQHGGAGTGGRRPPSAASAKSATRPPQLSTRPSSSIPLPVKSPKSKLSGVNVSRTFSSRLSRPSSSILNSTSQIGNKHTLEIQFLNKKKRLGLLKEDLAEKQKPVLDLYQNLVQIKKKLEELGKVVFLEEVKLMPFNEAQEMSAVGAAGESITPEMVVGMQTSIEEIPNTLMDICKNLLGRRNVIVELLESIIKSEVNVTDLTDQIDALKEEGAQLQSNLDVVINEHHGKIREIVYNWQSLVNDKKSLNTNLRIEDLEEKLRFQEKLTEESNQVIQELQKKLDERRSGHDRYVADLNNTIQGLKDHMQKLEQELETEKKAAADYKNRNNTNAQNSKMMRNKIAELESEKKSSDALNNELNRKVRLLQDQLKHKETQWIKEKEELTKSLKHQENMLQKLTADKNCFETRLETIEGERSTQEESLQQQLDELSAEMERNRYALRTVTNERDLAVSKCSEMEEHIAKMGLENRETMNLVSSSIQWGKDGQGSASMAQEYSESMAKDIIIQEFKDRIRKLEEENVLHKETIALVEKKQNAVPTETEKTVMVQHEVVARYKQLLAESEQKLTEKFIFLRSQEVSKLTSEIRQLKVRQEHLEEINRKCPTDNLQKMVEEGRQKLSELMRKSLESEQKLLQCENIIDKQTKQMNEMENMLRFRENLAGVLKASRDELFIEKESLTRYSQEMRTVLAEVTKEGKMKERLIKELQEKVDLRERQITKMEKAVRELETNLMITNEKRFKLQETIGSMEKELQSTKAHVNQLADINTRYDSGTTYSSSTLDKVSEGRLSIEKSSSLGSVKKAEESSHTAPTPAGKLGGTKVNSLIGLSLKQVDFLRSRLNYLSKVNVAAVVKEKPAKPVSTRSSAHRLASYNTTCRNMEKMVELTAKRYELLQKQAYESYEELTNLVKLAMSTPRIPEQ
ncbi:unnamed protein product, partial [Phaedon cochleariae]